MFFNAIRENKILLKISKFTVYASKIASERSSLAKNFAAHTQEAGM